MYQCRVHDQKKVVWSAYVSAIGSLMQGRTGRNSCHSLRHVLTISLHTRPHKPKLTNQVTLSSLYVACVQGLLEQLNKLLEKPLPMNRFRPNIVVTDCAAAAEDGWIEYGIGKDVLVESVKPCDRCTVGSCMPVPCTA